MLAQILSSQARETIVENIHDYLMSGITFRITYQCDKAVNKIDTYHSITGECSKVPSNAGKHATGVKRGKTGNWCQGRENRQLVPRAGKHVTGVKRGKTGNWCQGRENRQLVPRAGKHVTGVKRGKTGNWFQARENRQLVPSAGKHGTGAKRGKTRLILLQTTVKPPESRHPWDQT